MKSSGCDELKISSENQISNWISVFNLNGLPLITAKDSHSE